MQVRNDYSINQGASYQQSHLRQGAEGKGHIFEEEQKAAREREEAKSQTGKNGAAPLRENKVPRKNLITDSVEVIWSQDAAYVEKEEKAFEDKQPQEGFLKAIWNSLADEKNEDETQDAQENVNTSGTAWEGGIKAALSAVRQRLSDHITDKWELFRDKIKVGVYTALKRFGAEQGAFGALADKEGQEALKQGQEKPGYGRKDKAGQRTVPVSARREDHLMDSYTQNGEYCRLGENLTYRKTLQRREKEAVKEGEETMEEMRGRQEEEMLANDGGNGYT